MNPMHENTPSTAAADTRLFMTRVGRVLTWLIYAWVVAVSSILTINFFLQLLGADPGASFADWIYRSSERAMGPFRGIFPTEPVVGESVFDGSVLFAMIIYGLASTGLQLLFKWISTKLTELEHVTPTPPRHSESP